MLFPPAVLAGCILNAPYWTCSTQGEALAVINDSSQLCKAVWADESAGAPESMSGVTSDIPQKRYLRTVYRCQSKSGGMSGGLAGAYYTAPCADQGPIPSGTMTTLGGGTGKVCHDGCLYTAGSTPDTEYKFASGTTGIHYIGGWSPTGEACSLGGPNPDAKQAPECISEGGMTQCLREDGKHCASGASGTMHCWGPGDTGDKVSPSGDEYGTKDPNAGRPPTSPPPASPPPAGGGGGGTAPPSGGGTWGPPQSCTTVTTSTGGGPSTTSHVCTGGRAPCVPSPTSLSCPPPATPPPSGCTGSSCRPPADPPPCDPATADCTGAGSAGQGIGQVYEADNITIGTELARFASGAANSPILSFGIGFFGSCSGSGSCPSESWSAGLWGYEFNLSDFCTGKLLSLMNFAGYVALAGMALFAFKIALL